MKQIRIKALDKRPLLTDEAKKKYDKLSAKGWSEEKIFDYFGEIADGTIKANDAKALDAEDEEEKEVPLTMNNVARAIFDLVKTNDNEATNLLLKYRKQEQEKMVDREKQKAAQQDAMKAVQPEIEKFNGELDKFFEMFKADKETANKKGKDYLPLKMADMKPGANVPYAMFAFGRHGETTKTLNSLATEYDNQCKQIFSTLKGIEGAIEVKPTVKGVTIRIRKDLFVKNLFEIYKKNL